MDRVFISFQKSLQRLREIMTEEKTMTSRDAAIKRFEFVYELAWKSLQKFLRRKGIQCSTPKECFQDAFRAGLIADNEAWLRMIEDRNKTAHTYNENVAEEVYGRIHGYLEFFSDIEERLRSIH